MSLDTDLFIEAVKSHPALYDKNVKEYHDNKLRKQLWFELGALFVENWDKLSYSERNHKSDGLQKKWQNLRSSFKREYKAQKNVNSHSTSRGHKRHKYIYFDQLSFLCDFIGTRQTTKSMQQNDSYEEDTEGSSGASRPVVGPPWLGAYDDMSVEQSQQQQDSKDEHEESQEMASVDRMVESSNPKMAAIDFEESLLEIMMKKINEGREIDEDKYFLLSLLPAFKKFSEEQKFVARTQILNVMRNVRVSGTSSTNSNTADPKHCAM